jgi:tetratricopeptide (TPR) repeat protein
MGFDKSKVMRAAEKSLAQGKIPAAIKEYQQIVEHEPDDFSALNMLGDLLIRVSREDDAISCFTKVAEHYREEGFALKAIAMYRKMDRLKPGSIEIAARLAPLYEMQGLMMDARTQYLLIADAYTRGGHVGKALEILRKIADLDPNNTEIRLKLAAGYEREKFTSDAAEAFSYAGAQFYGRGAYEKALEAYSDALRLIPYDSAALSGITSTHIALGTADEVTEILETAIASQPDNGDLLSLLVHAHVASEDPEAAEAATAALIELEPSSFRRIVDVIRLYLKRDNLEAAIRLVESSAEQLLSGNEDATFGELLNEVLARDPEQMTALVLLVRLHIWQHDGDKLRLSLERLAETAQVAGLEDTERNALSQLVRLVPNETRFRDRLVELGGTVDEPEDIEIISAGEADEDVPTFESFVLLNEEEAGTQPTDGAEFEWNAGSTSPADVPSGEDPAASFADLSDGSVPTQTMDADSTSSSEFDFNVPSDAAGVMNAGRSHADPGAPSEKRDAALRQELESVDFYLAQGYGDIARDTLDMLERQFGSHAEIESRRSKLDALAPGAPQVAAPDARQVAKPVEATPPSVPVERVEMFDPAELVEAVDLDASPVATIDPGLAAIFDEFRTAVEEEDSPVDGDYETHYNLGLAYKEMDLLDEAVEEFQVASSLAAPRDGTPRYLQCCNLLGHCFLQKGMGRLAVMWFNRGLEAPGHSEDEYQALRFDLGAAYEQLGELDKAIDVFSEVYGLNVSYRGVTEKLRVLQSQKALS